MKYIKLLLACIFSLGMAIGAQAQDLHYTMYNMTPLITNPANTGAFLGTVRLSGIYRSQWRNTYKTPSVSADSPIVAVGKKKQDWIGVGLLIINDQVGTLPDIGSSLLDDDVLTTQYNMLSGAYHKVLDKKGNSVLTFGLQYGSVSRNLDAQFNPVTPGILEAEFDPNSNVTPQSLLTEFQGLLGQQNPQRLRFETQASNMFNVGLRLSTKMSNKSKLALGAAIYNPFRFDRSKTQGVGTITQTQSQLDTMNNNNRRIAYKRPAVTKLHAALDYDITDKLRLRPSAFMQMTSGVPAEMIVQTDVGYYLNDTKDIVISGGLGYRFGDAMQLLAGLDYKDWTVGASYDLNLSPLADYDRYRSGFEVGLSYIIKIYKDPTVDPAILCPKL